MKVEDQKGTNTIIINHDNYNLIIESPASPRKFDLGYVYFFIPTPKGPVQKEFSLTDKVPVTGRSMEDYPPEIKILERFSNKQYLEVGAGLGEFISYILKNSRRSSPKPIVIDPVNYLQTKEMLEYSIINLNIEPFVRNYLKELFKRNNLILDSNKVKLINMRLSEAIERYPELIGCADVVVDSCGPYEYSESELLMEDLGEPRIMRVRSRRRVNDLERKLLKKEGRLFTSGKIK